MDSIAPACHPTELYFAKGFCKSCYARHYYRQAGESDRNRQRVAARKTRLGDHEWRQTRLAYRKAERERFPLYTVWRSMKGRCYYTSHRSYVNYGGRGITVCDAWKKSYRQFEADIQALGPRPAGHTLDRIQNDGHYEPGNVRWADSSTQNRNKRPRRGGPRGPYRRSGVKRSRPARSSSTPSDLR